MSQVKNQRVDRDFLFGTESKGFADGSLNVARAAKTPFVEWCESSAEMHPRPKKEYDKDGKQIVVNAVTPAKIADAYDRAHLKVVIDLSTYTLSVKGAADMGVSLPDGEKSVSIRGIDLRSSLKMTATEFASHIEAISGQRFIKASDRAETHDSKSEPDNPRFRRLSGDDEKVVEDDTAAKILTAVENTSRLC